MSVEECITLKQDWSCAWGRGTLIFRSIDKALKRYVRSTITEFSEVDTNSDTSIFALLSLLCSMEPSWLQIGPGFTFHTYRGWTLQFYGKKNLVLHKREGWHSTLSTKRFIFEIERWVFDQVLSLRLNTARKTQQWKTKGKQPKHVETRSERLKARIETNKTKDTTHRRAQGACFTGYYSHPFLFVILTSLGSQARFFSQNPFLAFSLSAHLSIL